MNGELPFLKDKKCFILAGGSSLIDFDFNSISSEFTVGINRSFEKYATKILHCNDQEFYQKVVLGKLDEYSKSNVFDCFKAFSGIKVFPKIKNVKYLYDVYELKRSFEPRLNFDLEFGVYLGTNSGFGAIMLAIALGCTDIGLLGYDMQYNGKLHWHSGYPQQDKEYYGKRLLDKFKPEMEEWSLKFKEAGIKITQYVIRDESETSLRCFPIERFKS